MSLEIPNLLPSVMKNYELLADARTRSRGTLMSDIYCATFPARM